MAGLVLELAEKSNPDLEVKVIPGITASIEPPLFSVRQSCMIFVILV